MVSRDRFFHVFFIYTKCSGLASPEVTVIALFFSFFFAIHFLQIFNASDVTCYKACCADGEGYLQRNVQLGTYTSLNHRGTAELPSMTKQFVAEDFEATYVLHPIKRSE